MNRQFRINEKRANLDLQSLNLFLINDLNFSTFFQTLVWDPRGTQNFSEFLSSIVSHSFFLFIVRGKHSFQMLSMSLSQLLCSNHAFGNLRYSLSSFVISYECIKVYYAAAMCCLSHLVSPNENFSEADLMSLSVYVISMSFSSRRKCERRFSHGSDFSSHNPTQPELVDSCKGRKKMDLQSCLSKHDRMHAAPDFLKKIILFIIRDKYSKCK
jgi:hypothetical protein